MEQHEETNSHYPLGRGYGHDYMRGGEVFGGYGYREREDYARTRGGDVIEMEDDLETVEVEGDRPTMPHLAAGPGEATRRNGAVAPEGQRDTLAASPVPQLEHTYGDTGTGFRHSRSYYVTQAQLQQRFYAPERSARGPYDGRLRALRRADSDVQRDVQDALFFDTWVDAERISVEVEDGRVTLRGELPTEQEIRFACDDAWSVAGVREVVSEMVLRGEAMVREGSGVGG